MTHTEAKWVFGLFIIIFVSAPLLIWCFQSMINDLWKKVHAIEERLQREQDYRDALMRHLKLALRRDDFWHVVKWDYENGKQIGVK